MDISWSFRDFPGSPKSDKEGWIACPVGPLGSDGDPITSRSKYVTPRLGKKRRPKQRELKKNEEADEKGTGAEGRKLVVQ